MRIYLNENVFEKSLERIRFIFDEFEKVIVNISGGKDSTVVFNLALMVAEEKKRLPLPVFFIDQEAEWTYTIDLVKEIMYDKRVKPYWYQIPFRIENSASPIEDFVYLWWPGEQWIREKDPISIKENTYGAYNWEYLFNNIRIKDFGENVAVLTGMRTEESPVRFLGLTSRPTYKWITWGKKENKKYNHYVFHPLYDWSYKDVWKAIHMNKWKYNKLYDLMFAYGIPIQKMRVSSLHHQTALNSLKYIQEIDPKLYNALSRKVKGANTFKILGNDIDINQPPTGFDSWYDYRNYLYFKLIKNKNIKYRNDIDFEQEIKKKMIFYDQLFLEKYPNKELHEKACKVLSQCIITHDIVKIQNFRRLANLEVRNFKKYGGTNKQPNKIKRKRVK